MYFPTTFPIVCLTANVLNFSEQGLINGTAHHLTEANI